LLDLVNAPLIWPLLLHLLLVLHITAFGTYYFLEVGSILCGLIDGHSDHIWTLLLLILPVSIQWKLERSWIANLLLCILILGHMLRIYGSQLRIPTELGEIRLSSYRHGTH
jgi:hypothetical protein